MRAAELILRAAAKYSHRRRKTARGQILVLAVIFVLMFFSVAVVLIDVYSVMEARAWGYRVAQQAALAGASRTTGGWIFYQPTVDPLLPTPTARSDNCMDPIRTELDPVLAANAAFAMLDQEMQTRGLVYNYEIRVLPFVYGGTEVGWPPGAARLGGGDWTSAEPAVGVYLWFDVFTFLSGIVGRSSVTVHVFAAAGVAQPLVCPP